MKKKILSLIIGMVLLVTIVSAVALFSNREEMFNYFRTYKSGRETTIEELVSTIIYTTDKECKIDYSSERVFCNICFKYNVDMDDLNISKDTKDLGLSKEEAELYGINLEENYIILQDCINLNEFSSEEEDNQKVVEYVQRRLDSLIPAEEIGYKARDMKEIIITITQKPK